MTNKEFIDTIKVSYGISDETMLLVSRLLRINVNIRDSIQLLLKYNVSVDMIIKVLFTLSMYCDYSYERLLEFNELVKDYHKYFGKSGLYLWLYNIIKNENSSDYTLYRNMRVDRVACYVNKVYIEDEIYDLDLGVVKESDGSAKDLIDIGFIWINDKDYMIYETEEKDKFKHACNEIQRKLGRGEMFKLLVPMFNYQQNKKIARMVEKSIL